MATSGRPFGVSPRLETDLPRNETAACADRACRCHRMRIASLIGDARNHVLDACMPADFANAPHQRLDHFEDLFLLRERHFEIDLRKLRLAVGS